MRRKSCESSRHFCRIEDAFFVACSARQGSIMEAQGQAGERSGDLPPSRRFYVPSRIGRASTWLTHAGLALIAEGY